jgi:hypothetical protein
MNQFYFTLSISLFVILILIGFFRSKIEGRRPDSVLSINDLAIVWLTDNNWLSRLSVILLPFVFLYNTLAWAVYGLATIAELIVYLLKMLWQLLLIIWEEVLQPTVIWGIRLLWHYPLGFIWRFFEFSFTNVKTALRRDSILLALRWLFTLGLLGSILLIIMLLAKHPAIVIVGLIVFFFALMYAQFMIITNHRATQFPVEKIRPGMLTMLIWFGVAVGAGLLLALFESTNVYALNAFGLTIVQILLPVGVLTSVAFVSAVTCLPAYYQGVDGNINTLNYLRELLKRVPKLLFGQPFQLFGAAVVGIIPLMIMYGLNTGAKVVTERDFKTWAEEVMTMGDRIPNMLDYRADIAFNRYKIDSLNKEIISEKKRHAAELKDINNRINEAVRLKDEIADFAIHTFRGDAYVGETQFFSVPFISNCAQYRWIIEKEGRKVADLVVRTPDPGYSIVVYYTWREPGLYTISLTPSNRCGDGQIIEKQVNVINPPPGKKAIQRPEGKTEVCENEVAIYRTERNYTTYEWRYPDGTNTTNDPQLSITWGNTSGTVQVRGLRDGEEPTLWRGIDVEVEVLPGKSTPGQALLDDEENTPFNINRDFVFETREAATDSIARLEEEKETMIVRHKSLLKDLNDAIKALQQENVNLKAQIWREIHVLIGQIIAVFGLALALVLLLSTLFTYLPLYNFDLYTYRDEGKHYWELTLDEIRTKNPQQPLLGFFLLGAIVVLSVMAYQYLL